MDMDFRQCTQSRIQIQLRGGHLWMQIQTPQKWYTKGLGPVGYGRLSEIVHRNHLRILNLKILKRAQKCDPLTSALANFEEQNF